MSLEAPPQHRRHDDGPPAPAAGRVKALSLRRYLLAGILLPVAVFLVVNTVLLYRGALDAADTAYDRTLLASAKTLAELLEASGSGDAVRLKASVAYSALEAFEADNRSRIFYKVTGFQGETVLGFDDLPAWRGKLPAKGIYAALVDFYDDDYLGDEVRMAVLLQPVVGPGGFGMARIQVAETLELRETLAREILIDTLWHQAVLIAVIALVVIVVVQRATRPVRALSARLTARSESDLTPIEAPDAPRELRPLIDATNQVMARLQHLLEHQKRFVRDASHQLRTPLAVLKIQAQSALRGDIEPREALVEINETVDRATVLANQMLALAKVEQLRQQADLQPTDLAAIVRAVALDLAPLIAEKDLDFDIETVPATVNAHEWMLGELCRNLLHNAIKNSDAGSALAVKIATDGNALLLRVSDSGPGISAELATRLFQPFSAGNVRHGSGLGLAICREITAALGGSISLDNRMQPGQPGCIAGLDATVCLPRLQVKVQNSA